MVGYIHVYTCKMCGCYIGSYWLVGQNEASTGLFCMIRVVWL